MQQSSISSNYDVPYIDNFQYINAFTRQASVNELNFFTACELSGELIDNNHVYYDNGKAYDRRFVNAGYGIEPTLKIDTVTLNDSDSDIDEADEDYEEDTDWENEDYEETDSDAEQEVEENPYTIAALNEVGTLNHGPLSAYIPDANIARLMSNASPELQVILTQINDIATDSQQEQHIIF
jgi:hypothetical protein